MTRPTHQPVGVKNPIAVAAKEAALLALLRDRPGLRVPEISTAIDEPSGATSERLHRLLKRGEVAKVGREWRLPRDDDDEPVEWIADRPEPPDDPKTWIRSINRYVRSAPDQPARYG